MIIVRGFIIGLCLFIAGLLALPSNAQFNGCTTGFCSGTVGSVSLLLNTLSATSKVAYSTRKLRSAYAGPAFKVTRSSDQATQDIGFSGNNLDTAALLTFVGTTGSDIGRISIWYDQSGNGLNATPPTGLGPRIVTAGSVETLNSNPASRFYTADGGAGTSNVLNFTTVLSQPDTITLVVKLNSLANGKHFTDGNGASRQIIGQGATAWQFYAGSSVAEAGTTDTLVHGWIGVFNGAGSVLYQDNASLISGTNIGADTVATQIIGTGSADATSGNMTLPEYILFTSSISSGDRSLLTASWQTYWGTP